MRITNEYFSMMQDALGRYFYDSGVSIYKMPGAFDKMRENGIDFGVNWSAKGTRPAQEARLFAKDLEHAADLCERLNGLHLKVDYLEEWNLDEEKYDEVLEKLTDAIRGNCFIFTLREYCTEE